MSKRRIRSIALLLVSLLVVSLGAQAPAAPPGIDALVERVRPTFDVPGISLAIVKDDAVVLARGYGVRKLGEPTAVDGRTLFGIASNSKVFTATALGLLVEEGKVAWDAPVIRYLPWFQLSDPYVTRELTVRDLLVHRSGLGLGAGDLLWWPPSTYTRREIAERLRFVPLETSFRSAYAYDNVLYLVAGEVIEAMSGLKWEDFIRTRILAKAGMSTSHPRFDTAVNGGNVATPHARVEERVRVVQPFNPDPPPELAPLKTFVQGYALGLNVREYRGHGALTHTGGLVGLVSRVLLIPDIGLGVSVLTNQESGEAFNALAYSVADHYLKAQAFDWVAPFATLRGRNLARTAETELKATQARDAASKPSLPLAKYAGTYADPWYGDIEITESAGRLGIRFSKTPALTGTLEHWQHDTFVARWTDRELRADAYVTFALKPDGSIERVRMEAVSPATDFSFDFQDLLLVPRRRSP
jgi:CubicO group peptidase (beta-lactamase class C family)